MQQEGACAVCVQLTEEGKAIVCGGSVVDNGVERNCHLTYCEACWADAVPHERPGGVGPESAPAAVESCPYCSRQDPCSR